MSKHAAAFCPELRWEESNWWNQLASQLISCWWEYWDHRSYPKFQFLIAKHVCGCVFIYIQLYACKISQCREYVHTFSLECGHGSPKIYFIHGAIWVYNRCPDPCVLVVDCCPFRALSSCRNKQKVMRVLKRFQVNFSVLTMAGDSWGFQDGFDSWKLRNFHFLILVSYQKILKHVWSLVIPSSCHFRLWVHDHFCSPFSSWCTVRGHPRLHCESPGQIPCKFPTLCFFSCLFLFVCTLFVYHSRNMMDTEPQTKAIWFVPHRMELK